MRTLVDRLLTMTATPDRYRLERASIKSVDDGLRWMKDWHDRAGRYVWMSDSDTSRRRAIHHWRFLRYLHGAEIVARGGQSSGD